jgi:DNA primase
MPGIDYHQVRRQVSMTQVLDLIGFQASGRRGPQLRGPCPIPGCSSTSHRTFSVQLTRQIYHCFACNSHGNPLDLWSAVRRLPLHAATIDLCRTASLPLPRLPTSSTASEPRSVPFRASSRNP